MADPRLPGRRPPLLPHKVFVGAFHKTGSVLMGSVWSQASRDLGLQLWGKHDDGAEPETWDVCYHQHSEFGEAPSRVEHRGILVIRDPRDIIISAAHYHCTADEAWLHKPVPQFGGRTYQETISGLGSDEERYLFELRYSGANVIRRILRAREKYPDFRPVRFEDLVTDYDLAEYQRVFRYLGFRDEAIAPLLAIALANSIFAKGFKPSAHIRSGRPEQWTSAYTPRVEAAFLRAFRGVPEQLGYRPFPAR